MLKRILEIPRNKKMNTMINFDEVTTENTQKDNPHWPRIPDHPYRILTVGGSGSGKTNSLLSLIHHQEKDYIINKISLYAKNP